MKLTEFDIDWLEGEIESIDGYGHDAYWFKNRVMKLIREITPSAAITETDDVSPTPASPAAVVDEPVMEVWLKYRRGFEGVRSQIAITGFETTLEPGHHKLYAATRNAIAPDDARDAARYRKLRRMSLRAVMGIFDPGVCRDGAKVMACRDERIDAELHPTAPAGEGEET